MAFTGIRLCRLAAVVGLAAASLTALAVAPPVRASRPGACRVRRALPAGRIDVGDAHFCAIDGAGMLSCWGSDGEGRLGNGAAVIADQPSPSPVDTAGAIPDTWTAITAGFRHNCAIAADGTAWCWGSDSQGQLGNGAALTAAQVSPSAVDTAGAIPDTWQAVSAFRHTCAIAARGHRLVLGLRTQRPVGQRRRPHGRPALAVASRRVPPVTTGRGAREHHPGPRGLPRRRPRHLHDLRLRRPALTPLFGDWDGDGSETPGTFEAGTFKLKDSHGAGDPDDIFAFGDPRGFAVAGDFDADGRDDVAGFRNGPWQVRFADDGATTSFSFGTGVWPGTVPVAGDWDGDGTDGIATFACPPARGPCATPPRPG